MYKAAAVFVVPLTCTHSPALPEKGAGRPADQAGPTSQGPHAAAGLLGIARFLGV